MRQEQFHRYTIYEDGTVINTITGRILFKRERDGRVDMSLLVDGKRKSITLSRLMYWLFTEKFDMNDKNKCVSYKDGNGLNINVSNLILVDRKDLIQGEKHRNRSKITDAQVEEIKKAYTGNKLHSNQYTKNNISLQDLANKYGVTKKEIHHIVIGTARNKDNYKLK